MQPKQHLDLPCLCLSLATDDKRDRGNKDDTLLAQVFIFGLMDVGCMGWSTKEPGERKDSFEKKVSTTTDDTNANRRMGSWHKQAGHSQDLWERQEENSAHQYLILSVSQRASTKLDQCNPGLLDSITLLQIFFALIDQQPWFGWIWTILFFSM